MRNRAAEWLTHVWRRPEPGKQTLVPLPVSIDRSSTVVLSTGGGGLIHLHTTLQLLSSPKTHPRSIEVGFDISHTRATTRSGVRPCSTDSILVPTTDVTVEKVVSETSAVAAVRSERSRQDNSRDVFTRDLDLPRGHERELVRARDRVYEINGTESRMLGDDRRVSGCDGERPPRPARRLQQLASEPSASRGRRS